VSEIELIDLAISRYGEYCKFGSVQDFVVMVITVLEQSKLLTVDR
jgi:hypothetical protein